MQQFSERDIARRWGSGELIGVPLRTTSGERLTVLYPGRPGGGAGPDFRDAVIRLGDDRTLCGDVEVHLRGGDWRAHGHQDDPRYRQVILHVVLTNDLQPTRLADGASVPVLALAEVTAPPTLPLPRKDAGQWPCQQDETRLAERTLLGLLDQAGEARFLEKATVFQALLAAAPEQMDVPRQTKQPGWSAESRLLFVALAEGVGYGREREAFRAVGEQLVALAPGLTSPAHVYEGLLAQLRGAARLDRERLAALTRLAVRWRERGPWPDLWSLLSRTDQSVDDREALLQALTASGAAYQATARKADTPSESLSEERAAILIWNVELPFAYAWALLHEDEALAKRAYVLALSFPGLPSNQITRAMQKQLLLPRHPRLALAQQGLQHVHKHWCREKICAACPCAKADL
ncbi:MAG TPA: DUF2851 family protein [Ktedonobacterales bacterium]|nr:DUF2851 family protein [Ktedonobacterales bacterium]